MALIRSVVLYDSETRTLQKVDKTRPTMFERTILGRVYMDHVSTLGDGGHVTMKN